MSDQLPALMQKNLPAHLKGKTADINKAASQGIGLGAINRISLKQSRFRLIVKGEEKQVLEQNAIPIVIVRASDAVHKAWYEKAYSSGQDNEAPDCYSEDGIRPAADAKKKQCDSCATCPHNQWGSKITPAGKKAKSCSDSKRLAVMPFGKNIDQPDTPLWQLSVPATSMQSFARYMDMLNSMDPGVPYNAVVTKIAFDTDAEYPKINFDAIDYLAPEAYEVISDRFDSDEAKMVCSYGNPDGAVPSSTSRPEAPAKEEPAAEVPVEVVEEVETSTTTEVSGASDDLGDFDFDSVAAKVSEEKPKAEAKSKAKSETKAAAKKTTEAPKTEEVAGDGMDDVFGDGWDNL